MYRQVQPSLHKRLICVTRFRKFDERGTVIQIRQRVAAKVSNFNAPLREIVLPGFAMIEHDPQEILSGFQAYSQKKLRLVMRRQLLLDRTAHASLFKPLSIRAADAADKE